MLPLSPSVGMLELMLVLVLGVSLELWLGSWLARLACDNPVFPRVWDSVCAPLLRSAVIMAAVLAAYPALFGFRAAPALMSLMPSEAARGGTLFGLIYLGRVVAPLLPPLHMRPGMLDAVQGMCAVAVVFTWFADYLGAVSASVWPGLLSALTLFGMSVLLPALAAGLGRDFGAHLDSRYHFNGLDQLLGRALGMVAVAPIMMLYGYLLGMQLGM